MGFRLSNSVTGLLGCFLVGILRAGVATRDHAAVRNLTGDLTFYKACHHEKMKIPLLVTKAGEGLTNAKSPGVVESRDGPVFSLLQSINCTVT